MCKRNGVFVIARSRWYGLFGVTLPVGLTVSQNPHGGNVR
ncbi:hypothetical protein PhaeoP18_03071 [Phaeobacter piscinae]|uniref:Uncharacterized protein n=1 Tax=Phaeobacter piscinae TaxID=1580596 RepID=A0AAN1LC08_9RHOB|nr:hypothetical protein PhaeoP13_03093 [Phaeobacter piscinae]AUR37297.1 hypothetical protein PhaeoP18_03071 [Phaeobacter piscinae]